VRKALLLLATAGTVGALSVPAAADSVTYENTVKKIFAERCAACHISGAPSMSEFQNNKETWTKKFKGPSMADYKSVMVMVNGSDAGALMRRLDDGKSTKDGKPGNMYNYLGKDAHDRAERLEKIKKWVGNWSLKRRKELSDAELAAISAPER
jgi:mono/diheme cytochrome c family protein